MRTWAIVAGVSALALLGMGSTPRFLEELRIGGGYHEAADGGADLDKAGNISADGKVVADGGIEAGREGAVRGVAAAWDGPGANAPGCLRLGTTNGNAGYVFLSNDLAGLRVSGTLPAADTDGAFLTCGKYRGTGSTTDAVDLGSAEVSGILPASSVGNGLTDAQIADSLTIGAGTINNTPVGNSVAATGRFTSLEATGDLLADGGDIGISTDTDLLGLASGQLTVRGTLSSSTGMVEAGVAGTTRGTVSACSGENAPGSLKLASANGTVSYLFATNDRAGLRIASAQPSSDTDGAFPTAGTFRGSGSLTDSVDLGTAEVSGTLPASKVGNGLTDVHVADNLTITTGTINDTPIGAAMASTGRFTSLQSTGNLLVDGGSIGISADTDLIGLVPNQATVRGVLAAGVQDTTTGGVRLYGDNNSGGGWLALENGAGMDGAVDNWTVGCGLFGTFAVDGNGGSANLGNVFTINSGSGHAYFTYDATVQGGYLNVGTTGVQRGMVSAFASGGAPGCVRLGSANGTLYYVFATNDGAGLRIGATAPMSDTDGAWIASGKFRGTGSTTDAVDLGTAEVAGTLPASNVGTGLTDAQVHDGLTLNGGTINNTPIGASTASTGVFSRVTIQGALVTNNIMNVVANDTTPDVSNTHICKIPNTWQAGYDITMFDGGSAGQELVVMGGDSDCTLIDGSDLRLAGNWVAAAYGTLSLVFDGFDWLETGRSNN